MANNLVYVGGGTGFLGKHLVRILEQSGNRVRVITRNPSKVPGSISWTNKTFQQSQIEKNGIPEPASDIINVAGRNVLEPGPTTKNYLKEIRESRIGTNQILAAAINTSSVKPKNFVSITGVGYYESGDDSYVFDESWKRESKPKSFLSKLAEEWEQASSLSEQTEKETRRIIIRPGVILGSDGGIIKNLKLPFLLGLGGPIGSGKQPFPWIHVDDLARLIQFSLSQDNSVRLINGVAPEIVTNAQFSNVLAKSLNRKAFLMVPGIAMKLAYGSERAAVVLEGQRVKSCAESLGFKFMYPTLEEAVKECVDR